MQWGPPKARPVPRLFDRLVRLQPAQVWLLVLFAVDVAVMLDLLTGPDVWFGPVYLLVICVTTWSLGWKAGQLVGTACMGLTFAINGLSLYPYGNAEFVWNLVMRFGAISVVVAVIAAVRRAYVREWWLARTDTLTGALNRQAFFELAQTAFDPHGWRLLIYADLDGLKQVNDNLGHAAGDACLRAYGGAVRKMIRRNDIFARVGGDEFIIFMSVKDEAAARVVAARLHSGMNCIPAESGNLNCSVGGLVVPPGRASVDDLVRSADNLMYDAKLRGACLQLGVASNVERVAIGRARTTSRSVGTQGRNGRADDRRAQPTNFVGEVLPR
jgi:diguanylate cyclase (GGDEF)-like protein